MKFRSAVDTWLILVLLASLVLVVAVIGYEALTGQPGEGAVGFLWGVVIAGIIAASMYLALWPCEYILQNGHLHIRCGIIRKDIPYENMVAVSKSRNPLAAPALSLKRVKIQLKRGFALVSPADREKFMGELNWRINGDTDQDSQPDS